MVGNPFANEEDTCSIPGQSPKIPRVQFVLTDKAHLVFFSFALLQFTDYCDFFFFYKSVCDNCTLSKSVGTIFPTTFAHFVSLTFWQFSKYFKVFHYYYIYYGDL